MYTPSGPRELRVCEPWCVYWQRDIAHSVCTRNAALNLIEQIAAFISTIDGYAAVGTQQNQVSRKFAADALRLARDPNTQELAERRFEAAKNVVGAK